MEVRRNYRPGPVNWLLVPDILSKIQASIPERALKEKDETLLVIPGFTVETFSQRVDFDATSDFMEFVRNSKELPSDVNVRLGCYRNPSSMEPYEVKPRYFDLSWDGEDIRVTLARSTAKIALSVLAELEGILQLTPTAPPIQKDGSFEPERTAFVAHSFDDVGKSYAFQLTKFLSLLGFEVATGEGFSPERVSAKVKRRLLAQEIVIVVLSQRNDATWLVQEMSAADIAKKPLFLLIEEGVQFKAGILGDLEYIRFPQGRITECFTPLLEGLRELDFALS